MFGHAIFCNLIRALTWTSFGHAPYAQHRSWGFSIRRSITSSLNFLSFDFQQQSCGLTLVTHLSPAILAPQLCLPCIASHDIPFVTHHIALSLGGGGVHIALLYWVVMFSAFVSSMFWQRKLMLIHWLYSQNYLDSLLLHIKYVLMTDLLPFMRESFKVLYFKAVTIWDLHLFIKLL